MIRYQPTIKQIYLFFWITLLVVSAWLRVHDLSVRPMHNDEGVNAMFMANLVEKGEYRYNPENFHGPSLYYLHLPAVWLAGGVEEMSETVLRSVEAAFGVLTIALFFFLRRRLGNAGSFLAAVAFSVSCDFLFYSRYFIHETFFVFCTLALYTALVYWNDTRRPLFIFPAAASAALLFATKETAVVHFFVLGFAPVCAELYHAVASGESPRRRLYEFLHSIGRTVRSNRIALLGAGALAVLIWAALFSSFFTHWEGLADSVRTYFYWTAEGIESGHNKRFLYFFEDFIFRYETALCVLAFVGFVVAFIKNERSGLFLVFWTLGMIGAYSLIPYKTPWLIVNILLPMALVAGYGFQKIIEDLNPRARAAVAAVFFLMIALQLPQTFRVVYREYDREVHSQVYQHTSRDALSLVDEIREMAGRSEAGRDVRIHIFSREHWPLPYYLRSFSNVAYYGTLDGVQSVDAPLMLIHEKQKDELEKKLTRPYAIRSYLFRAGVPMLLYIDQTLASRPPAKIRELPKIFKRREVAGRLRPGLIKDVHRGMRFRLPPASVETGVFDFDIDWAIDKKEIESPFSIRWHGFLNIPETGEYEFILTSDDGSFLFIDDVFVIDNGGTHEPVTKSRVVRLEKGMHEFDVKYFDWVGEAVFQLRWKPPGAQKESPLPRGALFHTR